MHDDVIKWKHLPHYWPFVRGIQRSPVKTPHKGQWWGALMFSFICAWIKDWVNNRDAVFLNAIAPIMTSLKWHKLTLLIGECWVAVHVHSLQIPTTMGRYKHTCKCDDELKWLRIQCFFPLIWQNCRRCFLYTVKTSIHALIELGSEFHRAQPMKIDIPPEAVLEHPR